MTPTPDCGSIDHADYSPDGTKVLRFIPTGKGAQQMAKRLLESALKGGEIADHLGYDKHDPAGRGTVNSRNDTRATHTLRTGRTYRPATSIAAYLDLGPRQPDVPS